MPRGDGTGPRGQGSGIGRGMGQRGGSRGAGFGVGPGILQYPWALGQLTGGLNPGSISGVKYLPKDPVYWRLIMGLGEIKRAVEKLTDAEKRELLTT